LQQCRTLLFGLPLHNNEQEQIEIIRSDGTNGVCTGTDRAHFYRLSENKTEIQPVEKKGDVAIIGGRAFSRKIAAPGRSYGRPPALASWRWAYLHFGPQCP
jgi:hypothetical protein